VLQKVRRALPVTTPGFTDAGSLPNLVACRFVGARTGRADGMNAAAPPSARKATVSCMLEGGWGFVLF
jgi:hypothetical protein